VVTKGRTAFPLQPGTNKTAVSSCTHSVQLLNWAVDNLIIYNNTYILVSENS